MNDSIYARRDAELEALAQSWRDAAELGAKQAYEDQQAYDEQCYQELQKLKKKLRPPVYVLFHVCLLENYLQEGHREGIFSSLTAINKHLGCPLNMEWDKASLWATNGDTPIHLLWVYDAIGALAFSWGICVVSVDAVKDDTWDYLEEMQVVD